MTHDPTHEPHDAHDRDTVVVRDGGGSGMGFILGAIVVLILVVAAWYFLLGPGAGTGEQGGQDTPELPVPTVEVPS
jgi:hypothetical protein